ncbi:MAG: hypothetical protein GX028_10765 [Clostridiaceae bacterium]|nr:hypothetical protein [Clostridiaceae bacterium]
MGEGLILALKIVGLLFVAAGVIVIFLAPRIVDRNGLAEKKQDDPRLTAMMDDEQKAKFKRDAAIVDIKLKGLLLASPGFIIVLVLFR